MHLNTEKLILSLKSPVGVGAVQLEWQTHDGSLWAATGSNRTVHIFDHYGNQKAVIAMPGSCTGFGWDSEGTSFAAINDSSSFIYLWNSTSSKTEKIETGLRDPLSFMAWGKNGLFIAIGTSKGNVLLYNQRAGRKIPILGKHSKKILSGAWSSDNLLALGSEDKTLSISTLEGDTVHSASLRSEPSQIQFSEMKEDERSSSESTISAVVGRRTLILININNAENPLELAFQQSYGNITTYRWFGDGYILIGFSGGYCIAISTHVKEIGQELFQIRNHRDMISSISVCPLLNRAACAGDNNARIYDLLDLKESVSVISVEQENRIDCCAWSNDGRLLAITGSSGNVYIYLTRLNMLASVWQPYGTIAVLTSLKEVTVYDAALKAICHLQCELEPVFLACGPKAIALGLNNHAWLYSALDGQLQRKLQYIGSVETVGMNETHIAALVDGKVHLQLIEETAFLDDGASGLMESGVFPFRESSTAKITSHALAKDCLIYTTNVGDLVYFSLSERKPVSEYRHAVGWKKIYHDTSGTLLAAVDIKNHGYLYSPVKEILLRIPDFPVHHRGLLWESASQINHVFVAWSDEKLDVYVYHAERLTGSCIIRLCSTALASGHTPLLLQGPELLMLTASSKLTTLFIPELGISSGGKLSSMSRNELINALQFSLAMGKYDDAWDIGILLSDSVQWVKAANAALNDFRLDFAIRIYRHLGDISAVWSLEEIQDIEDLQLLSGHIYMILGNLEKAQDCYLKSSQPEIAIDMHTDVMEWEQALLLAEKLAPQRIGLIAQEYAQQLEQTGDFVHALSNYERALSSGVENVNQVEHQRICHSGIARCAVGSGDVNKGVSLAVQSGDRTLMKQCAVILEDNKFYVEAAELYETAGIMDQAAMLYTRLKNWTQVSKLIQYVTQPKVHIAYAKAKESQGQYKEALNSYELAGDFESAILLCLNQLHSPQDAVRIARRSKSTEGAKLIGKFFMDLGDYTTALEYLVMSKNYETAFEVARQNGQIQLFADILGDQASQDDLTKIALYYEQERNFLLTGKYYALAGQNEKAFKYFIKAAQHSGDDEKAINAAIHIVSTANDNHLAVQLIGFLNGEQDNIPKDGKYLFRLYLARHQYREATKTAIIIATEEQNAGNYKDAHNLLQHMYKELSSHDITIPLEMEHNLQLLHSYVIVRMHIRRGQHLNAARLLIRVAESISKFPSHVVPILTSTVIECDRAGLKNAAFQYAAILMKPEYRDQLDAKYKKKIESTVRRPPKGSTDAEDDLTPCPFCNTAIPSMLLVCVQCKQHLPMCIITGMHVTKEDLTRCPSCLFMAIRSEFIKIVDSGEPCPMCNNKIAGEGALVIWTKPIKPKSN
ncbi:Outer segment 6 [Daphnia magna]|uniref:Outer segment 6 n=1 Tax=Daphnia magna TaxID=35525 RepID=A0A164PQE0_9CRUS|nr:Outer segment 6 [Daphnia magna]